MNPSSSGNRQADSAGNLRRRTRSDHASPMGRCPQVSADDRSRREVGAEAGRGDRRAPDKPEHRGCRQSDQRGSENAPALDEAAGVPDRLSRSPPSGLRTIDCAHAAGDKRSRPTLFKIMVDTNTPASTRVRAADSVINHATKAIEIEDIDVRVAALEQAAELSKGQR